ncbi:MAG: nickel-dependent hydrogenase large subunit [Promethearchaeota archaeon]
MLKVVDVCTRVEGHGNIKLYIQDDNIQYVEFEISAFRGFENILIGKKLFDVPKIVSRICGLCHASQTIASCKAIEDMFSIEPSEQAIILRRLLMTGELIKSHIMHFFFHSMPDLIQIFKIKANIPNIYQMLKFDPQLTSYVFDLIKFGTEIDKIFGARSTHMITPVPGGVLYHKPRKDLKNAQKYFQKALNNIEYIIDKFINLFSEKNPPPDFKIPNAAFLGMHNYGTYDRYQGILRIIKDSKKPTDFQPQNYNRYFTSQEDIRGIDFNISKNKAFCVGPYARNQISENYGVDGLKYTDFFNRDWRQSILFSNLLRLMEIFIECTQALSLLDNKVLNEKASLVPLNKNTKTEGIGLVEAPRGTLLHHYFIDDKKRIEKVRLFIATEINIPLINKMIFNYAQNLYEKTGDINLIKKEVQKIIRAFDPCIACATH